MKLYEHVLGDPLTRRGMQVMFAVAVPEVLPERARAELYARWCAELQHRAAARRIAWLPASGDAYTFFEIPTPRVEANLLRILETTPVLRRPRAPVSTSRTA